MVPAVGVVARNTHAGQSACQRLARQGPHLHRGEIVVSPQHSMSFSCPMNLKESDVTARHIASDT